jgi:hypothetical protein
MRDAPAASRAKLKKHTSIVTTGSPETSGLPCASGFNGFLRARRGDRALCLRPRCDATASMRKHRRYLKGANESEACNIRGAVAVISFPLKRMCPSVGCRNLVRRLKHVVLPAPLGPISAGIVPFRTLRLTSRTAKNPENCLVSQRVSRWKSSS